MNDNSNQSNNLNINKQEPDASSLGENFQTPQNINSDLIKTIDRQQSILKKVLILVSVILIISALMASYFIFLRTPNNNKNTTSKTNIQEQQISTTTSENKPFFNMIETSKKIKYYSVNVSHETKVRPTKTAEGAKKYSYTGSVDISDPKNIKLKATFDVARAEFMAKGETYWIGNDIFTKLASTTATNFEDGTCSSNELLAPKSPQPAKFTQGYVQTSKKDFFYNCSNPKYLDLISLIFETTAPMGDIPIFNSGAFKENELGSYNAASSGLYAVYDEKLVDYKGKKAYTYNVVTQNYRVSRASEALNKAMGFVDDSTHITNGYDSDFGSLSPGRYLKVWVDADNNNLLTIKSIVDNQDSDLIFETTTDYSNYNQTVIINRP